MIACFGPATFVAFALFLALALILTRVGLKHDIVPIVRAETPPYDWEREGI